MKYLKKKKKAGWIWILAVVLLVAVIVAAALLLGGGSLRVDPAPAETTGIQTEMEPPVEETSGIPMDTPYMTFTYPQEWEGKVEAVQTTEGRNSVISFKTEISGKEVVLFSVILGQDAAEGYLLGQLHDENQGVINVYSRVTDIDPADWSEAEYNEICSLQERVNDIIVQFQEDPRFSSGK